MRFKKMIMIFLILIVIVGMMPVVSASPEINGTEQEGTNYTSKKDNKEDPLTEKQLELKEKAIESILNGKSGGKVVEVAKGQFVELEREGESMIWTVLGEFADLKHNEISEPDRSINNTTIWTPDFNKDYYMDLLFNESKGANSMTNYYIEQSSGRFAVAGDVTDWVSVPGNYATYDDNPDSNVWNFIEDSINGWYENELNLGKSPEEINEYLSQFDVWDRYDYDMDGDFDEPDGYIDTFQSVHAGEGEEAGASAEAIWSHSWYARYNLEGIAGPSFNMLGGIQIGNSDYWVGKYTIQPENGGVGVFAHEFGHDLGLPDLYAYDGENGTGFWTLMSSGSWLSDGTEDIGSKPSHMGAWEKFQLGWLNYEVAYAGEKSDHRLGPMEFNTKQAQGVFVILPQKTVVSEIGTPYAGEMFFYSGMGNNLDNFMYKSFTFGPGASLNAKVNYEIELDWDYAYVVVSTDGGVTWVSVNTNLSTDDDPNVQNYGYGITGESGGWVDLTADLSAFEGDVMVGFRYWTDGAAVESGFMIDEISITGYPIYGAETEEDWTFKGFRISTGTESKLYNNYYLCEYRSYMGYDSTLKVGPYYFGYPSMENYVDHFPYQDGLLIHYWDTSQSDNDIGDHPGQGLLLPIDAHYEPLYRVDNELWRNRIQTYDSTFTISPTDGIDNLHQDGVLSPIPSLPGVSTFDDRTLHYSSDNPMGSVIHPNTGTMIKVVQEPFLKKVNNQAPFMQIRISPAK
ncbi:MAG: immune inhibitor A [Bacillota bacterium]|nr:immune inhibitor A [Bacillota bacterium]